ncbi:MAG: hypothetical protein EXR62_01185 [Chloroflexi bacterium]|nr:hypothetical protein [Chloroflexota bacterium]
MNPRYEDVVMFTERNKDWLRQVERERLAQAIEAGAQKRESLRRRAASWAGRFMVSWGQRLQVYATNEA